MPGWTRYAAPIKGEYTITVVNKLEKSTIKVMRAGDRIREETTRNDKKGIVIADLKTGLSYSYAVLPDGRYDHLSIIGPTESEQYTFHPTERVGTGLGESCRVWEVPYGTTGIRQESCLTADGVLLWQKVFSNATTELQHSETISIDRSTVKREDLVVPTDLLELNAWDEWSDSKEGPNDEVLLQSSPNEQAITDVLHIKRFGAYKMTESQNQRHRIQTYDGEGISIQVIRTPEGQFKRAEIKRVERTGREAGRLIKPEETREVLGESCRDYNMAVGVSDYWQTDCRTDDGIVLLRESASWGAKRPTLVATSVTRGKLALTDAVPPAGLLTGLR